MSRLRRCLRKRQAAGQTLVLFALMSLLLLAGLGLVIDGGIDYANRRIMQNAADIAALAGTRAIARQNAAYPAVRTIVETTAVENGVASAADVTCHYVNSSGTTLGACDNHSSGNPISSSVVGVQVQVTETHTTLFMRAVGIRNSGTAANAQAQIQKANRTLMSDVLIAVCGVETATSSGTPFSIFNTELVDDEFAPIPSPPATVPQIAYVQDPATIDVASYSYDWNQRDAATGALTLLSGSPPNFLIQGADIARCRKSDSWNGLIDIPDSTTSLEIPNQEEFWSRAIEMRSGDLASSVVPCPGGNITGGPCHTINGPQGCARNQAPSAGCIMLLPIIDNYLTNASDTETLYARDWGAFAVTQVGGNYYGRLIKNYPLHADSSARWTPSYVGPVTITLVKQS